ncbi:MAG: ribonuclease [Oscillospiraceae bacterium]|nr:ribonuclease [Oscillospiraceae bacterium]
MEEQESYESGSTSEESLYEDESSSEEYSYEEDESYTEEAYEEEVISEEDSSAETETVPSTEAVTEQEETQADDEYALADEPFETEVTIDEDGVYTSKEDVALYIHIYECLPDNFITKKEAQALGWSGGSLEPYAPGMCIGGNRFGNYEGLLPEEDGRTYTECDIDTLGAKSRGAKRIVFSNDGLIYYTEDHYESFELLYGEE